MIILFGFMMFCSGVAILYIEAEGAERWQYGAFLMILGAALFILGRAFKRERHSSRINDRPGRRSPEVPGGGKQ